MRSFLKFLVCFALCPLAVLAQAPLAIHHAPLNPQDLPDPGAAVTVTVIISNTKSVDLQLVGIFTIDGHLVTVPISRAALNRYDEAQYELELPSPVRGMSYEFVLYRPEGGVVSSPRYAVSRPCAPRALDQFPEIETISDGSERMRILIEKSQALNVEIDRYERVLRSIEELAALGKEDS